MKNAFTLFSIPANWENQDGKKIIGIALPEELAKKIGGIVIDSTTTQMIKDLFDKQSGIKDDPKVSGPAARTNFTSGDLCIIAGGMTNGQQQTKTTEQAVTSIISILNSLSFQPVEP